MTGSHSVKRPDYLVEDSRPELHRPRKYIESLEARLAHFEGVLQQVRPEVALDQSEPMPITHMPSAFPNTPDNSKPDERVFSRALRAPLAEADGFLSGVSFSRILSATMSLSRKGGRLQHSRGGHGKDFGSEVPREVSLRLSLPTLGANLSEALSQQ
ncbi:hypothetical protein C8034_v009059 [Colletotrichum sidae]|uniref:Uncharacterized protein n=1 Tax=Colletotrichum sidae TaxID=1347389 RepID=A0A4R8T1Y0_9PEZI|nr:hypothetical protein C8034_v009059 [Colletotrichum sidae]